MRRIASNTTRVLLATGLTASVFALAAPGAQAAPSPDHRGDNPGYKGFLNMWEDDNYDGHHEWRKNYDNDFHNDSFNDQLSSVSNRTPYYWELSEDTKNRGANICIRPWSRDNNIGNNTNLEDDISSVVKRGKKAPNDCETIIGYR